MVARESTSFHPHGQLMEVDVLAASGQDFATVRLAGSRMPRTDPAWLWLDPDEARPPAPTFVAVGTSGNRALCLDLVRAPDVLTITGDAPARRRIAAILARQLVEHGIPVTVVGSALGIRIAGAHAVRSLVQAEIESDDPTAPQIVFCPPAPDELAVVRRLTGRSTPRTVVVLVGEARPGRWSIDARQDS
jgi:hypothetical protein